VSRPRWADANGLAAGWANAAQRHRPEFTRRSACERDHGVPGVGVGFMIVASSTASVQSGRPGMSWRSTRTRSPGWNAGAVIGITQIYPRVRVLKGRAAVSDRLLTADKIAEMLAVHVCVSR